MPAGSTELRSHVHADLNTTLSSGMFVMPRVDGNRAWTKPGQLTFAKVTDGLSNTFAIGEKHIKDGANDGPTYLWGHFTSRNTASPMNGPVVGTWGNYDANFGSSHVGGCHFLLGDGAVRFISENISLVTYNLLAARDDNKVVGEF